MSSKADTVAFANPPFFLGHPVCNLDATYINLRCHLDKTLPSWIELGPWYLSDFLPAPVHLILPPNFHKSWEGPSVLHHCSLSYHPTILSSISKIYIRIFSVLHWCSSSYHIILKSWEEHSVLHRFSLFYHPTLWKKRGLVFFGQDIKGIGISGSNCVKVEVEAELSNYRICFSIIKELEFESVCNANSGPVKPGRNTRLYFLV